MPTITSPPQLKKPAPKVRNPEDDVRSDLLKAIRDGIALKKTEAKEAQENKQGQGLSDVATILARRVAVEFSDSDDGPSDSEYDSDDWGETDAWRRGRALVQQNAGTLQEYFYKSQESLATVIDFVEEKVEKRKRTDGSEMTEEEMEESSNTSTHSSPLFPASRKRPKNLDPRCRLTPWMSGLEVWSLLYKGENSYKNE
jgi:hypothetical protein